MRPQGSDPPSGVLKPENRERIPSLLTGCTVTLARTCGEQVVEGVGGGSKWAEEVHMDIEAVLRRLPLNGSKDTQLARRRSRSRAS